MILTFEIFGRARNHGKKFLKLCQTSLAVLSIETFLKGGNSWGVRIQEDKIFRPIEMLVFAMIIVFLTFLGLRVKFSRSGKTR